jgi:hypothetical protein
LSDDARSVYEQTLLEDDDSGVSYRCFVDPEMGVAGVVASRPGAMTTGVACLERGRRFVGVEHQLEAVQEGRERLRSCTL